MSRIAEALSKTFTDPTRAAAVDPDQHPWGADLAIGVDPEDLDADDRPSPRRPIASPMSSAPEVGAPPFDRGDGPDSHLAAMVERVFLPVSGEPARSIAFVGVGAPSSAVTAGAAELLAHQTGSSVCVVDANFAAPGLHTYFSVPNDRGLADAIDRGVPLSDSVREVRPNLWLLSAGAASQRPSFSSDAVRIRVAQFIARFDYVLMDIESIAGPADARGLAPLVAGIILVVSADATRREAARRATEALRGCGAAVMGAVLTERRFPIPDALYRRI